MKKLENNLYEIGSSDLKNIFKERPKNSHKGMFGTVGILGGSIEYTGSIKLANMSSVSLRSGPGIVRVIAKKELSNSITPYLLEQTFYPLKNNSIKELEQALNNLKALAIGMGWSQIEENKDTLIKVLKIFKKPIVIDADGLNILATLDKTILRRHQNKIILTPHLKEFSRLTNLSIEDIKKDPIIISKSFAKEYNIILLLKGEITIVTDGEQVYLTKTGSPGMSKAGSGDILSGILVGLLGYLEDNLLTVASASYLSGLAGELAQEKYTDIAMKSSDTIEFIPAAIKYIRENTKK